MSLVVGDLLADRYRLEDLVAVGGMGQVWRARDAVLDREVAVKVLRPELTDDAGVRARFRGEARHAAAVRHPSVAAVHDYGELPDEDGAGRAYLVMDFVAGRPLDQILAETGPLSPSRTLDIATQVADALAAAHEAGLVHRDVKPSNLLVGDDGHVTVTDFGISRAADAVPVTGTGLVMGTPEYLAPEQAAGQRASAASDVYALGVVAYEALSGHPPFRDGTPAEIAQAQVRDTVAPLPSQVPEPVSRIVLACLAKSPTARPDARTLASRLPAVAAGADDAADLAAAADLPSPEGERGDPRPIAAGAPQTGSTSPRGTIQVPVTPGGSGHRTTYGRARGARRRVRTPLLALVLLVALLALAAVLRAVGVLDAAAPAGLTSIAMAANRPELPRFPGHEPGMAASRAATETKDGIG